jgi:hypothetical protein
MVMIRLPGIDNGGFVVLPDTVWYAWVFLLSSASAMNYTGSALVSMLETYNSPDNGNYYYNYFNYTKYMCYIH